MSHKNFLKNYSFSLILLFSIALGAGLGLVFKEKAAVLKPLGDIFLNLLFTAVVPLVFFSISSAIAEMSDLHRLGKIMTLLPDTRTFTKGLPSSRARDAERPTRSENTIRASMFSLESR